MHEMEMPLMFDPNSAEAEAAKQMGAVVDAGMQMLGYSTIAINLLMGGSIKLMASFLEHAQILSLLPCMAFNFPGFLSTFFASLRKVNLVLYETKPLSE